MMQIGNLDQKFFLSSPEAMGLKKKKKKAGMVSAYSVAGSLEFSFVDGNRLIY